MNDFPLRRLFLIILITVSFLLTYFIFTQDAAFVAEENTTTTTNPVNNISLENKGSSAFAPSRIIKYSEDGRLNMLKPSLLKEREDLQFFNDITFSDLNYEGNVSINEIVDLAHAEPSYVYVYDEAIPYQTLSQLFNDFPNEVTNMSFDYVVFPRFSQQAYFYNSRTQEMYRAKTKEQLGDTLDEWVNASAAPFSRVSENYLGNKVFYLPIDGPVIAYKDYLLSRLPNSLFVDILFDNPENVNVRTTDEGVRYNDFYSELFINSENNSVNYKRQQYSQSDQDLQSLLEQAYNTMSRTENWTKGVRVSEIDYDRQQVFFRRYLEGYPIFAENYEDGIKMSFSGKVLIGLSVNMNVVQTPIDPTSSNYQKTLANGQQVMDAIAAEVEDPDAVDNIRVGYEWSYNEETKRVAHFEPYWYYRYENKWHKLADVN